MIYFIQEDGQDGYIKIGFVEDLEVRFDVNCVATRIGCLQVGNARKLKILAVMKGTLYQEKMVQERFQKVRGEWFYPLPKLMDFIKVLPAYPNLCALSDELGDLLLNEAEGLSTAAQDRMQLVDVLPQPTRLR